MKKLAITGGLLSYLAVALLLSELLAAGLYFFLIKTMPESVTPGSFIALWQQLSDNPAHRKRLQGAALIALGLTVVVPFFAWLSFLDKRRPLHGDARFANNKEVEQAGLSASRGIIVGCYNHRYLIFGGQQFVLLAAPTRSGKGVGIVIPNLLNWPDSVVVLDIKGENHQITSGFRQQHGQEVYLFNPFAADFRSHRWNPLSAVSRDPNFRVGDIMAIAAAFYPTGSRTLGNEAFFNEQAQNLFLGLALYLLETPGLPVTLGEILRQGSGRGRPVDKHLKAILAERNNEACPNPLSGVCVDALNRFLSNSDNTLASIKASFEGPLLIFTNPIVDAATSGDDFDLREVRRKRMSIYLSIPPNRLDNASRLLNIFFSQLINLNTATLPASDQTLKYQCLLLMDEFTAPGCIEVFRKSVAFIAGYGLRLMPIVQSEQQIIDVYGREAAETFMKNHDVKIAFPPDDIEDAERVSRTLGYFTEKATSKSRSRSATAGAFGSGRVSHSENTSDQRRALLLPQEIRELPANSQIIFKSYCKPILAEKIRYFSDSTFTRRVRPATVAPVMDMAAHKKQVEMHRIRHASKDSAAASAQPQRTIEPDNPSEDDALAAVGALFDNLDDRERTATQTLRDAA